MSIEETLGRTRVTATYADADGFRLSGRVRARLSSRITSTEDPDTIIPAGSSPPPSSG